MIKEALGFRLFLFGSFLYCDKYNDIDLIIIYENITFTEVKKIKEVISNTLQKRFDVPIHFTVVSKEEYMESPWLRNINKLEIGKYYYD